jgi:hypothetical protein
MATVALRRRSWIVWATSRSTGRQCSRATVVTS